LKFRKENIKDAEEQLAHIVKEINNEKEMILQEELRHNNCAKEYDNNQKDMIELHNQIILEFENKIIDLNNRISNHQKQSDNNEMNLIKQKNDIVNDITIRTDRNIKTLGEMNSLCVSQKNTESQLNNQKSELENGKYDLEMNINSNRLHFNEELHKLKSENEANLTEKENNIESLSGNVAKLQNDLAYNIEEIRAISADKNNMVNYLVNTY
jgi:hypothetical protein